MVYLRCMQVWRAEEVLVLLRITAALSWSHFRFLSMLRSLPSLFMCSIQVVALLILVLRCLKKRAWKQITKVYWRYANIVLAWTDLFMPLLHSLRTKLLLLWWHVRGITSPLSWDDYIPMVVASLGTWVHVYLTFLSLSWSTWAKIQTAAALARR